MWLPCSSLTIIQSACSVESAWGFSAYLYWGLDITWSNSLFRGALISIGIVDFIHIGRPSLHWPAVSPSTGSRNTGSSLITIFSVELKEPRFSRLGRLGVSPAVSESIRDVPQVHPRVHPLPAPVQSV